MLNANQQSKLNRLIARKKAEDPTGFLKAKENGDLLTYLKNDLKEAGIDASTIHFDQEENKNNKSSGTSSSSPTTSRIRPPSQQSTTSPSSFDEYSHYISLASSQLDSVIFAPYFHSQSQSKDHSALIQKLSSLQSFRKVSQRLETLKVISFSLGLLCGLFGLRSVSRSPLVGVAQLLIAHDALRISYNCYIRQYLSVSIHCLTGDLTSLGNTVLQVASAALGLSNRPDPLMVLEHGVYWKAIFMDTISSYLYSKYNT